MNNHNADVLVIVFEKERTSVTCWPPSRNLGALGRGTCSSVQTSADLNSGQNRAFSQVGILIVCVFVWDMMQLDSGVFGLCCHATEAALVSTGYPVLESPNPPTWSPWHPAALSQILPKQSWLWGLPLLYILKTKWIFHPSFFGEKNSVQD